MAALSISTRYEVIDFHYLQHLLCGVRQGVFDVVRQELIQRFSEIEGHLPQAEEIRRLICGIIDAGEQDYAASDLVLRSAIAHRIETAYAELRFYHPANALVLREEKQRLDQYLLLREASLR